MLIDVDASSLLRRGPGRPPVHRYHQPHAAGHQSFRITRAYRNRIVVPALFRAVGGARRWSPCFASIHADVETHERGVRVAGVLETRIERLGRRRSDGQARASDIRGRQNRCSLPITRGPRRSSIDRFKYAARTESQRPSHSRICHARIRRIEKHAVALALQHVLPRGAAIVRLKDTAERNGRQQDLAIARADRKRQESHLIE